MICRESFGKYAAAVSSFSVLGEISLSRSAGKLELVVNQGPAPAKSDIHNVPDYIIDIRHPVAVERSSSFDAAPSGAGLAELCFMYFNRSMPSADSVRKDFFQRYFPAGRRPQECQRH